MLPTRHLKVFLCHSSGDKPVVRELYQKLNSEGWIDVWLDEVKLFPGQDWSMEIEKAVEETDIVIVCLSTRSVDKEGYVQRELRYVLNIADEKPEGSIFVIPLRLDECVIPRRLRGWQWLDYFSEDQKQIAYKRLLESLKLRAETFGISTHAPAIFKSAPVGIPKDRQAEEKKVDKPILDLQKKAAPKLNPRLIAGMIAGGFLVSSVCISLAWNFLTRGGIFSPEPTNTHTPTPSETLTPTPSGPFDYTVQQGDSLKSIADRFNLGEDGILRIYYKNQEAIDQNNGVILVGQAIKIPPPGTALPTFTPIPESLEPGTIIEYRVLPGDTIRELANRFRTYEEAIMGGNELSDPEALRIGQVLQIPANLALLPTATPTLPTRTLTPSITPSPTETPVGQPITGCVLNIKSPLNVMKREPSHRSEDVKEVSQGRHVVLEYARVVWGGLQELWFLIEDEGQRGWVDFWAAAMEKEGNCP